MQKFVVCVLAFSLSIVAPAPVLAQSAGSATTAECSKAKKVGGAIFGAILGAVIAHEAAKDADEDTRNLATAGGAVAGGLAGMHIGCKLSKNDRASLDETTLKAAQTNKPVEYTNAETGVKMKATPVLTADAERPRNCRDQVQEITLSDGTSETQTVRSCQGENGWEIV